MLARHAKETRLRGSARRFLSSSLGSRLIKLRDQAYVNGEWVSGADTFDVTDPGSGEHICKVADLTKDDVSKAVDHAYDAFPKWRDTLAKERSDILRRMYELHMEHIDDLTELLCMESGKAPADARGEIMYGASFLEWFSEEARRMYGDTMPDAVPGRRILTYREPVGVCGLICPWNFPNAMLTRKIGPALAAGCTVVCKPASETPLSALAIAEIAAEAGVPAGVLNVVTSSKSSDVGKVLTSDHRVRKLSFTGSTRIGKLLYSQCADTVKKVSLELGGNAPFIVFDDADLDLAVEQFMVAKWRSNSQACVAANFIYVQSGVYDKFAEIVADRVSKMKVGHFSEKDVDFGPVINKPALEKMQDLVKDAKDKGATCKLGGNAMDRPGFFFEPTVMTDVTDEMRLGQEETFGPIAPLIKFDTEEEVLRRANVSRAGLAAYFFTSNMSRAFRVSRLLENGMVGVNTGLVSNTAAPFGGVKESGLGREGSKYGLDDYTEIKYIAFQAE
ncbi:Aldehyde dehydrogenase [Hondaea fermentalgiana]|uniref:Succinate-semialdehyde dehydrogenase, mitochondrial n=1 Tax=Hondaea fermentalgiana TaxID=2315210 RepID=A0A2R5FYY7_9STRA|nr:Aldehyde dehydrogenase [Hondaea fermentalgiana]|eukprot:GBG23940.1 Aldehyde dehydrogenase [Hondaea fermentalgiana]